MKKNLQILVFALLLMNLATFVFQSCTKDAPNSSVVPPVTLESMVNSYNAGMLSDQDYSAKLFTGTMEVITLSSKEILFFLKQSGKSSNEMFVGQGLGGDVDINSDLGIVKVAYLHEAMVVQDQSGKIYTFSIGEGKGNDLIKDMVAGWKGKGYGFALNGNVNLEASNFKGAASLKEMRTPVCHCETTGTDADCDSGGSGSTSCSQSTSTGSCSVSCSGGYYACCCKS